MKKKIYQDKKNIIILHKLLCDEIRSYNYAYYKLNDPIVSDTLYDEKYRLLKTIEKNHQLNIINSPTQTIASDSLSFLKKHHHKIPMLSLSNAYDIKDIEKFILKYTQKYGKHKLDLECEAKLDGVAISLHYTNSVLDYALTRGDGIQGEDVTHNIKNVPNIPLKLQNNHVPHHVEIRGELIIYKDDFIQINKNNNFASPRNFVSGSIRKLNSEITDQSKLKMFAYGIGYCSVKYKLPKTQLDLMNLINTWGFEIIDDIKILNNIKDIHNYYLDFNNNKNKLPFDIDGVVYKINSLIIQKQLGSTNKSPRWALAHKFISETQESEILSVKLKVGKSGLITPIAKLNPIFIKGIKISNVNLHNFNNIYKKNLFIHSRVLVRRSGEVIPEIVKALPHLNNKNKPISIVLPQRCPECFSLIKTHNNSNYCTGEWYCVAQRKAKIQHFISSHAMNIYGIGKKTIDNFITNKIIVFPYDLYKLKYIDLICLFKINKKSAYNILKSINESKKVNLCNFIYAMGIKNIGFSHAIKLSNYFQSLTNIKNSSINEIVNIPSFGKEKAKNIIEFFKNPLNNNVIDHLLNIGIFIINN